GLRRLGVRATSPGRVDPLLGRALASRPSKERGFRASLARSLPLATTATGKPRPMLRTRVRAGAVAGLVMSLVFATLLTLVQRSDALVREWAPKLGERTPVTLRVPYSPIIIKTSRTGIAYGHARIVVPRGTVLEE